VAALGKRHARGLFGFTYRAHRRYTDFFFALFALIRERLESNPETPAEV